jgi:hypothetical protein
MIRLCVALVVAALLLPADGMRAQQVADTAYRFPNPNPAFAPGEGPTVCVDGGHNNFHTIEGRYAPFATLVGGDGFAVRGVQDPIGEAVLASCGVLVIANSLGETDRAPAALPRQSAFTSDEIDAIIAWVLLGGSLLLIADHAPYPAAVRDLAALMGFHILNGFAAPAAMTPGAISPFGDVALVEHAAWQSFGETMGFTMDMIDSALSHAGVLGDHPVLRGRNRTESVGMVVAFQGQAFQGVPEVMPLLIWGPDARAGIVLGRGVAAEEWPVFTIGGWLAGGARTFGAGRVVMLGEAAMCSAQIAGGRLKAGMNAPIAPDNAQFCLNAVRWLAGVL